MNTGIIFAVAIPIIIVCIVLFVLYSRRQHERNLEAVTIKDSSSPSKNHVA
jgi:ABC-type transport system involved in cytochrome bd biosynthesis fused ATPase/permease subunit